MEREITLLAEALARLDQGVLLVVTGAGVSAPSGLPTFRGTDPGAIWSRDVTEIGTRRAFERDPVGWWRWFIDRFGGLAAARPNAAHHALVELERWRAGRRPIQMGQPVQAGHAPGDFLLVTQNIDTLHEQAGSRRLIQVHGRADRVRCSRAGCERGAPHGSLPLDAAAFAAFSRDPRRETLPRCPACGALLRAHALLFDELYEEHADYGWSEVTSAVERMGLALFVGTSFSVGVTALALREALGWRLPVFSVDPAAAPPSPLVTALRVPAEALLPAVCDRLGARPAAPPET